MQTQTADRLTKPELRAERKLYTQVKRAELDYASKLRQVAKTIGDFVNAFDPFKLLAQPGLVAQLQAALDGYSWAVVPWARATSARMIADVSRRDEAAWRNIAHSMSRALRKEIQTAPTGVVMKRLMEEQVGLIRSMPIEAGRRVHEITTGALYSGQRANELAKQIKRTGKVTASRANLIARTEVARTSSNLVEARALHVGSEGYIWRSSEDSDVRNVNGNPIGSHRLLNGKFIRWDDPPVASEDGTHAHAGQIYNCRCYPEPVLPDNIFED